MFRVTDLVSGDAAGDAERRDQLVSHPGHRVHGRGVVLHDPQLHGGAHQQCTCMYISCYGYRNGSTVFERSPREREIVSSICDVIK